jgi:hypothetical protein
MPGARCQGISTAFATRPCLDVPDRQSGRVEADDLVIHAVDPGLALLHQFRLEAAGAVAGDRHRQFPILPLENRGRSAVAAIGLAGRCAFALFIAKMRGQLGTQHPFHELDLQLFHQPGIAEQIFRALHALQRLIQQFLGDRHSCFLSVKHEPDHSYTENLTLSRRNASCYNATNPRRLAVVPATPRSVTVSALFLDRDGASSSDRGSAVRSRLLYLEEKRSVACIVRGIIVWRGLSMVRTCTAFARRLLAKSEKKVDGRAENRFDPTSAHGAAVLAFLDLAGIGIAQDVPPPPDRVD